MCVFEMCKEKIMKESKNWFVGEVCEKHFVDILKWLEADHPGVEFAYREDFARIMVLLLNKNVTMKYIDGLNKSMSGQKGEITKRSQSWMSFAKNGSGGNMPEICDMPPVHKALQAAEKKLKFKETTVVPLAILTQSEFLALIKNGYVFNDFGARYTHGAYTHRLQWYAISEAIRLGKWNKPTIDLYSKIGSLEKECKPFKINGGQTTPGGVLWTALLDNAGKSLDYYGCPDKLHEDVRTGNTKGSALALSIGNAQAEYGARKWNVIRSMKGESKFDEQYGAFRPSYVSGIGPSGRGLEDIFGQGDDNVASQKSADLMGSGKWKTVAWGQHQVVIPKGETMVAFR